MKKFQFSRCRLFLIPLVLLSCLLLFASCGNVDPSTPKVDQISISNDSKPQTLYAQGQDFDLSKGMLIAVYEDGTKGNIQLNAEGVTVTGYDKNTLGDQTLVITYGGKSINLTVTVEKRMTFSGYETNYFIGTSLNTEKGKVVIVKDDGTTASVRLNDPAISVVSFDSSTAGMGKQATIRYSADGTEYTDTITVNVYDYGTIKFTKPAKTAYASHDAELNLQGGYFTVTAKDNDQLTEHVPLTQDMVSGYDPSAATRDNINTALTQTITVSYAGNTYEYNVTVRYSGISIMRDAMEALKDVNLDAYQSKIDEAQGLIAVDALQAYMNLTPTERDQLDKNGVEKIARLGAYFCTDYFNKLVEPLQSALIFQNGGIVLTNESTYQSVKQAVTFLSDPEYELYTFAAFQKSFVETFADVVLKDNVTIGAYVPIYLEDDLHYVVTILELLLQLHDDLAVVPDVWTMESLADYGESIESVVRHVADFSNPNLITTICTVVSGWRANNDYLDIVYAYYYQYNRDMLMEEVFGQMPIPVPLQEVYSLILQAANVSQYLKQQGVNALWADVSWLYLYYYEALEKVDEILNDENTLYKDLYFFAGFDSLIEGYVEYSENGVVNLMGPGYGEEQINALLDTYIDLLEKSIESDYIKVNAEKNQAQLQSIFDQFVALTPAKQSTFLSAMFYMYGKEPVRDFMLLTFPDNPGTNLFVFVLENYFKYYLPESTHGMVQDMLYAMEYYLNKDFYEDAMTNFGQKMDELNAAYKALSEEDRALFDQYMGGAYTKYNLYLQLDRNGSTIDPTAYIDLFNEMAQAIRDFNRLREELVDPETSKVREGMLGITIAAYDRMQAIAEQIFALNDPEITALFSSQLLEFSEDNMMNLDKASMNTRLRFLSMMHSLTFTFTKDDVVERVYAWDIYNSSDVANVMSTVYYVMIQHYDGMEMDAEKVLGIMREYRNLMLKDITSVYYFQLLDGDAKYYEGLQAFFDGVLTHENKAIGTKLLEAEKLLRDYAFNNRDEEYEAAFKAAMEELIELRATVTDTENFDTYLAEMYAFYLGQYQAMNEITT